MEKLIATAVPPTANYIDVLIARHGMPDSTATGEILYLETTQPWVKTVNGKRYIMPQDRAVVEISREYLTLRDRRAKGPFFWDGTMIGRYEVFSDGPTIMWRQPTWAEALMLEHILE